MRGDEVPDVSCGLLRDQNDTDVLAGAGVLEEGGLDLWDGGLCFGVELVSRVSKRSKGRRRGQRVEKDRREERQKNRTQNSLSVTIKKLDCLRRSTWPTPARRKPVTVSWLRVFLSRKKEMGHRRRPQRKGKVAKTRARALLCTFSSSDSSRRIRRTPHLVADDREQGAVCGRGGRPNASVCHR